MSSDKILVFVPAYNCAAQIGRVLGQFSAPETRAHFHTILILDNQSRDGTAAAAIKARDALGLHNCIVGRNVANYGLGGSHKAAFTYAREHGFTHVVVLHGDDQGSIADLLPILARGAHRSHDACLGARFMAGSQLAGYSKFRIFGNYVFNTLFSIGSGRAVYDLGSGLNIFSRPFFDDARIARYSDDLPFNVFLLLGAFDARRKLMFFPISWREDDQVSNVKMMSQATKTLTILFDYVFRRKVMRNTDHRATPVAEYRFEMLDNQSQVLSAQR